MSRQGDPDARARSDERARGREATTDLPVIDVDLLRGDAAERQRAAGEIHRACRGAGFFFVVNHDIDGRLFRRLESASREFFADEPESKLQIRMERSGRAWRGYFPVGNELTSGRPDLKEGLYFGAELPATHPKVAAGTALHGPNLFPLDRPELRDAVLAYMDAMTDLGHLLVRGIALSLGLEEDYFDARYTRDPLILFRVFNYPSLAPAPSQRASQGSTAPTRESGTQPPWSVGEHTDYGLLTILWQDDSGGLEVKSQTGWIAAPPLPGALLCNIGDMLDRMTGGLYRSTPHRVRNPSARDRLSFAFFFDPAFDAQIHPIEPGRAVIDDAAERWDRSSVHTFAGTYGEYLVGKVSKVFPLLGQSALDPRSDTASND